MKTLVALLTGALGAWGGLASLHLTVLSVASLFYRPPRTGPVEPLRHLVLIPAHDEEAVIGQTLAALDGAARPRDTVIVIADRCTDATASIARSHGVTVLERGATETPGKSAALQAGLDHARPRQWDVLTTIDADSRVEPGFFDAIDAVLATGAVMAQARSEAASRPGIVNRVGEAAFTLQGITLPRGRDRLGLPVRMRGTGMVIRRGVALEGSFLEEGASEDLRYGIETLIRGIRARHVDGARLRSESPPSVAAATEQRVRWESGRIESLRRYLRPLLAVRSPGSIEAALLLATPPVAIAAGCLVVGALGAWWAGYQAVAIGFGVLLAMLVFDIAVGLLQARSGWRVWAALLAAPVYVLWKVWVHLLVLVRLRSAKNRAWAPTPRT